MNSRPLAVLVLLVSSIPLGACGTSTGRDGGYDSGVDSGVVDGGLDGGPAPATCASIGALCGGAGNCCGNLACQEGTCAPREPANFCAGFEEPCGAATPCCSPTDGGPLICVTIDAGFSLCVAGYQGSGCHGTQDCASPFVCLLDAGVCDFPTTGVECSGNVCHPGDDCSQSYQAIENEGTSQDPCFPSGLVCTLFASISGSEYASCLTPTVAHPPSFPNPDGPPFDDTVCSPGVSACAADAFAAPRSAATCGSYFMDQLLTGNDHCLEACRTGDDCDSIAWDCVGGVCVPNYCFAAGTTSLMDGGLVNWADVLSPYQVAAGGLPVSGDPAVLFQPCPLDGGFSTACLPQYDTVLNGSSGICVRVGGNSSGGVGAACDPNPYRNNLEGLCQAGTYCDQGTCLPWCDLGTSAFVQCPTGMQCTRLPPGPIISTPSGITNSIGVCTESCDPYAPASANSCSPLASDAGSAPLVCKFAGVDNDIFPPPGTCVDGVANPVEVGQPCEPFGWMDPCVSGAICMQSNRADAAVLFTCEQLCDPVPSPGLTEPNCPDASVCVGSASCGFANGCNHMGTCQ